MLQTVTPDGEYLIVGAFEPKERSILRLKIREGSGPQDLEPIVTRSSGIDIGIYTQVAKDGKWLLHGDSSRQWWAIPYQPVGAKPVKLHAEVPFSPCLSGDGRQIYGLVARRGLTVQKIDIGSDNQEPAISKSAFLFPLTTPTPGGSTICAASHDGSRILVIASDDDSQLDTQLLTDWTTLLRTPDVER